MDWERKLTKNWFDFQHLHIITWHNTRGVVLTCTTILTDPTISLPIQNGAVVQHRSERFTFVHVQLALDFQGLKTTFPPPNTVLCGEYYI